MRVPGLVVLAVILASGATSVVLAQTAPDTLRPTEPPEVEDVHRFPGKSEGLFFSENTPPALSPLRSR